MNNIIKRIQSSQRDIQILNKLPIGIAFSKSENYFLVLYLYVSYKRTEIASLYRFRELENAKRVEIYYNCTSVEYLKCYEY